MSNTHTNRKYNENKNRIGFDVVLIKIKKETETNDVASCHPSI